jgi:hypothetical protein
MGLGQIRTAAAFALTTMASLATMARAALVIYILKSASR